MNTRNGMRPVHPGEILAEELEEMDLAAQDLAQALDMPFSQINEILKGHRAITADTALRLSRYFATTPQFWLNLQQSYELRIAEIAVGETIEDRVQPRQTERP